MSRNRKPLKEQKGNLTREQQENIRATEEASAVDDDQLKNAPRWLTDKTAQAEWQRLIKELKKAGLVCNLDRNNVAMYCNCWSDYIRVSKFIKTMLPEDEKTLLPVDDTGLPNVELYAALIKLRKTLIDDMMKISRTCGLTIDSRLKAGQIKVDKTADAIEDAFGDI